MSTMRVTDTQGRTVHIGPHDIFKRDVHPLHKDTADLDVRIDAVIIHGRIAVLMWRIGETRGATVYDCDDRVEVAA